ncbi:MAG: DUF4230 domain-containing protein [Candidatus Aminicenantes bacterium]|nr:DUF4230 domain-containing protein [Candidatus Aminicenantes bacterium]
MRERRPRPPHSAAASFLKALLWTAAVLLAGFLAMRYVFHLDFGFFRETLTFKPTALTLDDVKAVEYLITAEYYGEVIGTARNYFVRTAVPEAEKVLLRLMNESNPAGLVLTPGEELLLDAVRGALIRRGIMNPRLAERSFDRAYLITLVKPELMDNRFTPAFADLMVESLLARRDLAYLARGVVQAGYDLAKIGPAGFFLCPVTGTVFIQAEPEILSKDINPWLIYDEAGKVFVKGFEIISQAGIDLEADDAIEFIKAVKEECRRRLLDDAQREGIRERARSSAEETLANLFRMIDPSIKAVVLVPPDEFAAAKAGCAPAAK